MAVGKGRARKMTSVVSMWPYLHYRHVTGRRFYCLTPVMRAYMGVQKDMMQELQMMMRFEVYSRLVRG